MLAALGWDVLRDTLWDLSAQLDGFELWSALYNAAVVAILGCVPGIAVGKLPLAWSTTWHPGSLVS